MRPVWTDSPVGAESGCSHIGPADSYGYSRTYGHADTYTRHTRDGGGGDNGNHDRAAHGDPDSETNRDPDRHTDTNAYLYRNCNPLPNT